jgi:Flp pilus assembly protein TadD
VPLLTDGSRLVRSEAAIALSRIRPQRFSDANHPTTAAFESALAEYRAGQLALADHPSAQMNLGVLNQNLGNEMAARSAYEHARQLEPTFVPARFNLAMLDALTSRPEQAEAEFREVMRIAPELPQAAYSLGLLLAEDPDRLEESAELLKTAARAAPENPRFQFNAGLSAQHLGRHREAESFLRRAVNLRPGDSEFRNALTILYVQSERWVDALPQAERLLELAPGQPGVARLVGMVRERARQDR